MSANNGIETSPTIRFLRRVHTRNAWSPSRGRTRRPPHGAAHGIRARQHTVAERRQAHTRDGGQRAVVRRPPKTEAGIRFPADTSRRPSTRNMAVSVLARVRPRRRSPARPSPCGPATTCCSARSTLIAGVSKVESLTTADLADYEPDQDQRNRYADKPCQPYFTHTSIAGRSTVGPPLGSYQSILRATQERLVLP